MAITARRVGIPHFLPTTTYGVAASLMFAASILLLAARLFLTPDKGLLPPNFLVVFVTMAASGVLAIFGVAVARERSVTAFAVLVVGSLAAAFLLAETLSAGPPTGPSLGAADNGARVAMRSGTQLTLQLPGNPTTGYGWEATISNPTVLRESSPPEYKPAGTALGGGGTYTFHYEATAPGETDLTLVYRRSWEAGVQPIETFRVRIVVN